MIAAFTMRYDDHMATAVVLSATDYLRSSFEGLDREFYFGDILERGMPTYLHSRLQALLCHLFFELARTYRLFPASELRLEIEPGKIYRIPDVALFADFEPGPGVVSHPPLLVVEILSPDDRMADVVQKLNEYRAWGICHIWLIDAVGKSFFQFGDNGLHQVSCLELPEYGFQLTLDGLG